MSNIKFINNCFQEVTNEKKEELEKVAEFKCIRLY